MRKGAKERLSRLQIEILKTLAERGSFAYKSEEMRFRMLRVRDLTPTIAERYYGHKSYSPIEKKVSVSFSRSYRNLRKKRLITIIIDRSYKFPLIGLTNKGIEVVKKYFPQCS